MLTMFTVYQRPKDYPDEFVVREYEIRQEQVVASRLVVRAPTLDAARRALRRRRPDLVCIPRALADDPVIVESWI